MAEEFKLNVKGHIVQWLDATSEEKGLKEVKIDLDALSMAMSLKSSILLC